MLKKQLFTHPASISVSTFGPLQVVDKDTVLWTSPNGKQAALFAYLATEPGSHLREDLARLFWPGLPLSSALLNLRQTLFKLRKALESATGRNLIHVSRYQAELVRDQSLSVAAIEFMSVLPQCQADQPLKCKRCLAALSRQAALYRAPFLAEMSLADCPEFEEWLHIKREIMHQHALKLLMRLSDCFEEKGEYARAAHFAARYLDLEPCSEGGHLRLMRLYLLHGKHENALAQYETCCQILDRELGVMPNAELQELAAELRRQAPQRLPLNPPSERRQAVVLYCSVQLNEIHLDPEDALSVMDESLSQCATLFGTFGGHVVYTFDGGLLVYFGYPKAIENSALQAMRAACAVTAKKTSAYAVSVGVHAGLMVANSQTPDAVGTTSRIAIRLRDLGKAGEIIVSRDIRTQTSGFFLFKPLEPQRLNSEWQAQMAYMVLGESGKRDRLNAATQLTPFMGRANELASLGQAWSQAKQGQFQGMQIFGEAGIGKSRLVKTFVESEHFSEGDSLVLLMPCYNEGHHSPMQPLISMLFDFSRIQPGDDSSTCLAKLKETLERYTPDLAEAALQVLCHVMALTDDDHASLLSMQPPSLLMRQLFLQWFHALCAHQPLLLVVEDVHWADEMTVDVLHALATAAQPVSLFLLMTTRPAWHVDWAGIHDMHLAPLPDADMLALVEALRSDMSSEEKAGIVHRAEGIPLFAEELAALPSHEHAPLQQGELPPSLHDVLMSRIDALGADRGVVQLVATFGREIQIGLLERLVNMEQDRLRQTLNKLLGAGIMQQVETETIRFRHALIQDVAYLSQTRQTRKTAHRRVAQAMEQQGSRFLRETPERLAYHWQAAGDASRAASLWLIAGRCAAKKYAHHYAMRYFENGLGQLQEMADESEKARYKLELLLGLAQSDQIVSGYGNARSVQLLNEAEEILLHNSNIGDTHDSFAAVWGLWEGAGSRQGFHAAIRLAERLVRIAENEQSDALRAQAHYALGNSLFWHGQYARSTQHLKTALNALPVDDPLVRDSYGLIVSCAAHAYLSWSLWMQGKGQASFQHSQAAIAIAQDADEAYSLSLAFSYAATLHRWSKDVEATERILEAGMQAAQRYSSPLFEVVMQATHAWVQAMQGEFTVLAQMEQLLGTADTVMKAVVVSGLEILADALMHCGQMDKTLFILNEAIVMSESIQNRHYLAELHRMAGCCWLAKADRDAAHAHFEKALSVAEEQGALVFAQRAAADMAALMNG